MCYYRLVKKAIVNLPIKQKKGNLKHFMTSNPLSRSDGGPRTITLALLLMLVRLGSIVASTVVQCGK